MIDPSRVRYSIRTNASSPYHDVMDPLTRWFKLEARSEGHDNAILHALCQRCEVNPNEIFLFTVETGYREYYCYFARTLIFLDGYFAGEILCPANGLLHLIRAFDANKCVTM
jgi:hypothetical protein